MYLQRKRDFIYENNIAKCIIHYKHQEFCGNAYCHPQDKDMESQRTGFTIAEARAEIKLLKHILKTEVRPQLQILTHIYTNMCHSSKFNKKSYEAKTLLNQIKRYDEEERGISYLIQDKKDFLKSYINGKEEMYQKIRKARNN